MPARPLTPKQQRFVAEYLLDLNASAAYARAGYAATGRARENNASRLLGNAGVAAAVAAAQAERSSRTGVTQDEVLAGLKAEATLTGEGSSPSARVSAWVWLGKHLGMWREAGPTINLPVKVYLGVDPAELCQPSPPAT